MQKHLFLDFDYSAGFLLGWKAGEISGFSSQPRKAFQYAVVEDKVNVEVAHIRTDMFRNNTAIQGSRKQL